MASTTFDGVLDAIAHLPPEQQAELVDVVRRRLAERGRQQIVTNAREAPAEFAAGKTRASAIDEMKPPIPVLRIFDEFKAKEFYIDFLGFKIDWEYRFGETFPLYMQVSRDACVIHLSEHHGDACPGSTLRIEKAGLDEFCVELQAKNYKYAKPGVPLDTPWGLREIYAPDPFGNKLYFYERTSKV